jgi:hypothetical protein
MLQVQDKANDELVAQIFNFLDYLGNLNGLTTDIVESFLQTRGILKPSEPF